MQIIFAMLFPIFTFKDQDLAENWTNLADSPKIVGLCRVHGAHFFQLQGTLDTWWNQGNTKCQQSRGVVVRIVEGKLRAEALLNPVVYPPTTASSVPP